MNEETASRHIDRRLLISGLAAGMATLPGYATAQQAAAPADEKPKVWLDMDQRQLDDAYARARFLF